MSGVNGDKARFNIRRKKKIHRRAQQRAMFEPLFEHANARVPQTRVKAKEKTT
jgi:hypothetical protein